MKIKQGKPIITWLLKLKFPVDDRTIITWGDTIYSEVFMPEHTKRHEEIHGRQQHQSKIFGLYFMIKFMSSKKFRLKVELEAFRYEYGYICRFDGKNINALMSMATQLSSKLYGNIITYEEAIKQIQNYDSRS